MFSSDGLTPRHSDDPLIVYTTFVSLLHGLQLPASQQNHPVCKNKRKFPREKDDDFDFFLTIF